MIGEILIVLLALFGISWFFGFWDHMADKIGLTVAQTIGICIAYVMVYIGAAVVLYITLAYCHKWIGPHIFGG